MQLTNYLFFALCFLFTQGYSQSERSIIFNATDTIKNSDFFEKVERFTPTTQQIKIADSLAINYIGNNREVYPEAEDITRLSQYYRQYVGFIDANSHQIIFLNCFCRYIEVANRLIVEASGWRLMFLQYRNRLAIK